MNKCGEQSVSGSVNILKNTEGGKMWATTFILTCCYEIVLSQYFDEMTLGQAGSPWNTGNTNDYYYDQLHPDDALPTFTTHEHTVRFAAQGEDIILPCVVHNLGDFSLTWRRGQEILWVLQEKSDGPVVSSVVKDPRVGRAGTSLSLAGVNIQDAGNYTCEVDTRPTRYITHSLDIRVPPSVYPVNNRSVVTVKTGNNITLSCTAHGNPTPNITWSRKGGGLEVPTTGPDLTIVDAKPEHNGVFRCSAENGAGETASASITLQVMYPPKVHAESAKIYAGVDYDASLVCVVEAEPRPQIKWYRAGGQPVDPLRLNKAVDAAQRYSLQFHTVQKDDFGDYTCNATNFMGNASAVISLLGRPKPVRYYSEPQGDMDTNYTLIWHVESYSPVITYHIAYKNESDLEEQWVNFTVPGTTSSSPYHSSSHTFTQLEPGATYHVQITAVNEYGYSDINETFSFTTFNPESAAAAVQDEGSGASSVNLTPAEKRAQTIAFVTAISLSCFF